MFSASTKDECEELIELLVYLGARRAFLSIEENEYAWSVIVWNAHGKRAATINAIDIGEKIVWNKIP